MKSIDYLLKQLINGEIDSAQPIIYCSEKENITCPDEDYEYEAELIKEQCEEEKNQEYNAIYNDLSEEASDRIEEYRIEEQENMEEAVSYDKNTDTYMLINESDMKVQKENQAFLSDKDINYDYIEKVKGREGTLSEIVNNLDLVNKDIIKAKESLEVRLFIDIYDYFESILEIINEKRNDDYYEIYKAKDTLKKIEEAIEQNLNSEDWYEEDYDRMNEFLDCVDILRIEILYIINLLDNSSEYKIKRKKSRYRKKGFRKKSSKYFKLLLEGYDLEDISKLCNVNIESLERFFKRKLKEYKSSINDDEIINKWTIKEEQLNFFLLYMIKSESKYTCDINVLNNISAEEKKIKIKNYFKKLDKKT